MKARFGVCFVCPKCAHHTKDGPWVDVIIPDDANPQDVIREVVKAMSAVGGCDASLTVEVHYNYRKGEVNEI